MVDAAGAASIILAQNLVNAPTSQDLLEICSSVAPIMVARLQEFTGYADSFFIACFQSPVSIEDLYNAGLYMFVESKSSITDLCPLLPFEGDLHLTRVPDQFLQKSIISRFVRVFATYHTVEVFGPGFVVRANPKVVQLLYNIFSAIELNGVKMCVGDGRESNVVCIKNMPDGTTTTEITRLCRMIGKIYSLKAEHRTVMVTYGSAEECHEAVEKLNCCLVDGHELSVYPLLGRVLASQIKRWQVRISNLPPSTQGIHLLKAFGHIGKVYRTNISRSENEVVATITFYSESDAIKCEKEYDGAVFGGRTINVVFLKTVVLYNLSKSEKKEDVRRMFPNCLDVEIHVTDEGRLNYAFLPFDSRVKETEALEMSNSLTSHGVNLICRRFGKQAGPKSIQTWNARNTVEVLVLPPLTDLNTVVNVFEAYWPLSNVRLDQRRSTRQHSSFLVQFTDEKVQRKVLRELNGKSVNGHTLSILPYVPARAQSNTPIPAEAIHS